MNTDAPHNLHVMTPNDDGTYTCKVYEFDPITRERTQVGETELYRVATEAERDAHAQGKLKGRTRTAFEPADFKPFLLVKVEQS
jgi:hypothetical protein